MKHVDIQLDNGTLLRVAPVAEHTFRCRVARDAKFVEPGLVRYGIVRNEWPDIAFSTEDHGGSIVVRTRQNALSIDRKDGCPALYDPDGRVLVKGASAPQSKPDGGFDVSFRLTKGERLFGLGDETRNRIQKRGRKTMLWAANCTCYLPVPVLMSSAGWALFLNCTWRNFFDVGCEDPDRLRIWADGGELDFYLIAGRDFAALIDRYTDIVGKPALLPLSAYGLTFTPNGRPQTQNTDARSMLQDCVNLRRDDFPCDWIFLDPSWMAKDYDFSTEKDWDPLRFHIPYWLQDGTHPGTFISAAADMGFKLNLWLCMDYDVSLYEEYKRTGHWPSPSRYEEFYKNVDAVFDDPHMSVSVSRMDKLTKPQEAWFEHLKKFVDQGVGGFFVDAACTVNEHPDRMWANGMNDEEMHNLYPVLVMKQMYEGFKEHTGRRPLHSHAPGYAGIAPFTATNAGDTGGNANEVICFLNNGFTGNSNVNGTASFWSAAEAHFSVFEPWINLSSYINWAHPSFLSSRMKPIARYYLRLRYALLPYIYSMAHVAHRTGLPVVRAMTLAYPDDPAWDDRLKQFLFGESLLVSTFSEEVHLPGGRWTDFWTGKVLEGPRRVVGGIPDDRGGHLFVKGGAILPCWPQMDHVGEKPVDTIDLHVYPFGDSAFRLYEDDGVSFAYEEEGLALTDLFCREEKSGVEIRIEPRRGRYEGMPETRSYSLHVHLASEPRRVTVNDCDTGPDDWRYDGDRGTLRVQVREDPARTEPVVVQMEA